MNATVTKYSKVTSKDSGLFLFHGSTLLHSLQYGTKSAVFRLDTALQWLVRNYILISIFALQNKKKWLSLHSKLYLFFKCNLYYIAQARPEQFEIIKRKKCACVALLHTGILSAELPRLSAALMHPCLEGLLNTSPTVKTSQRGKNEGKIRLSSSMPAAQS